MSPLTAPFNGFTDTELTKDLSDEQRKRIASRSALRRFAETDDIARMVDYLLGEGGRNTGGVLTTDVGNTPVSEPLPRPVRSPARHHRP